MPSPIATVAAKPISASPAPAANATASAADAGNASSTGEASNSGGFAEMLLLQLGLGETQGAAPVAAAPAATPQLIDTQKDASESPPADASAGLSALFASLGIPQPKNLPPTSPAASDAAITSTTVAGTSANAIDIANSPLTAAAGPALGAAADTQTAKLAGFEETLAKAETKLEANTKTAQEVPPAVAAMHTPTHTQPAASEAAAHVATPVRDPSWAADFSQKVVWVASQEKQSAQLTLNPPQLGPLEVTISVSKDQTTAVFSSPHSEVRQAIETAMPQLREAFAAAGIQLGQASVNSESFRQQQGNGQQPNQNQGNGSNRMFSGDSSNDNVIATTPIRRDLGLVDTFA